MGQSFTRPAASLSWTFCQRNLPSDSRKHITTPLSPLTLGWRSDWLLVPTKILPPATTGLPNDCEPSWATHLMFLPVVTSHVSGMFFSTVLIMLRCGVPPHMCQSAAKAGEAASGRRARAMTIGVS